MDSETQKNECLGDGEQDAMPEAFPVFRATHSGPIVATTHISTTEDAFPRSRSEGWESFGPAIVCKPQFSEEKEEDTTLTDDDEITDETSQQDNTAVCLLKVMRYVMPFLTTQEAFIKLTRVSKAINDCISRIQHTNCLEIDAFWRFVRKQELHNTCPIHSPYHLMRSPAPQHFWSNVSEISRCGAPKIAVNIISCGTKAVKGKIPVRLVTRLSLRNFGIFFEAMVYGCGYEHSSDVSHLRVLAAVFAYCRREYCNSLIPSVCKILLKIIEKYGENDGDKMNILAHEYSKLIEILMDPSWLRHELEREGCQFTPPTVSDRLRFFGELVFSPEFCRLAHKLGAREVQIVHNRATLIHDLFHSDVFPAFTTDWTNPLADILTQYVPKVTRTQSSLEYFEEQYRVNPQLWCDEFGGAVQSLKDFQEIVYLFKIQIEIYGRFGETLAHDSVNISRIPNSATEFQRYQKIHAPCVAECFGYEHCYKYSCHSYKVWSNHLKPCN